jgi:hypothetical protein
MSKRSMLGAAVALGALMALPAASEAHCFGTKHIESGVTAAVDGTTTFVKRVAYRTQKFGDRVFGWMWCKHV